MDEENAVPTGTFAMPDGDDERNLVEQAKADSEAFGSLYERYVDRIFSYIYYRTGNRQDAEDLTARTFFRAFGHINDYENRGVPFSAWLYRIAHNLVANWHRDRGRRKVVPLDDLMQAAPPHLAPEGEAEANEEQRELLRAISHLPDDRQQLLILKFTQELSNVQIGQIMGRTEGAVKSLYHRTLIALREDLTRKGTP